MTRDLSALLTVELTEAAAVEFIRSGLTGDHADAEIVVESCEAITDRDGWPMLRLSYHLSTDPESDVIDVWLQDGKLFGE